jgi:glycosyltransferase involved in cell wall biosynthesis
VIEALACGLPVAAYATGALPELVPVSAGVVAPYGANPWRLESPSVGPLARGLATILQQQASFRAGARAQAEAAFDVEAMTDKYIEFLF